MLGLSFSRLIYIHYSIKLFRWIRIHTFSVASTFNRRYCTCYFHVAKQTRFFCNSSLQYKSNKNCWYQKFDFLSNLFSGTETKPAEQIKMAALGVVRQLRDLAADPQNRRKIVHDQGCLPGLVLLLDHNEEEVVSTALEVCESVLFTEPYSFFSTYGRLWANAMWVDDIAKLLQRIKHFVDRQDVTDQIYSR